MQARPVGRHGSGHTRRQDMGGGNRQTIHVGGGYCARRDEFGGGSLTIGQMSLADLLANRDDDALPTDHRAKTQCDGDRDLYTRKAPVPQVPDTAPRTVPQPQLGI